MDVRDRILEAALGLLAQGGAPELTQPRVARAAGVRQSHLTYYFPTRADLLQAVASRSIEELAGSLLHSAQHGTLGSDAFADALAQAIAEKGRTRTMLALVAAADRDPAVRQRLRRLIREVRARLGAVMNATGGTAGVASVAFLHTLVVGAAVLYLARDNVSARREVRDVLRRGIRALGPRSEA